MKKDIGNGIRLELDSTIYKCNAFSSSCKNFFHGQTSVHQPFYPVPDISIDILPNAMSVLPDFISTQNFNQYIGVGNYFTFLHFIFVFF